MSKLKHIEPETVEQEREAHIMSQDLKWNLYTIQKFFSLRHIQGHDHNIKPLHTQLYFMACLSQVKTCRTAIKRLQQLLPG